MKQIKQRSAVRAILALALILCLASTISASASYKDVAKGDWFEPYVTSLSEAGVIAGYPDGTFLPAKQTTAGEALRLVLSAAGVDMLQRTDSHWASGYLWYSMRNAYIAPGEILDLDAGISRRLIAKLAAAALSLDPVLDTVSPFADTDDPSVQALYDVGVLSGSISKDGLRMFYPQDTITRAEMSSVIYHIFQYQQTREYSGSTWNLSDPKKPEEGAAGEPLLGVDVSSHNGKIDWSLAADQGIEFAMIRAGYRGYTEGKLYIDERFEENLAGALQAGLKVGVYFFSQAVTEDEAVEEAEMLLEALDGQRLDMPIVFDWEPFLNNRSRTKDTDRDVITACARAFCNRVERSGYASMIYLYKYSYENNFDLSRLPHTAIWYARYQDELNVDFYVDMWQFSSAGKLDGFPGNVDLNWYYGPEQ
ncbi:MAG: S-layer homology domain-containing protein [Oscillospiraceae bacterium]|nr:S-layer homology domain-containing protein [Oscillospiraceae bacterium]